VVFSELENFFNNWMHQFPFPAIIVDFEFKVVNFNREAGRVCHYDKAVPNFFEKSFGTSLLPLLVNFKNQLSQNIYGELDVSLKEYGSTKLIGHKFEGIKTHYIIVLVPLFYKERYLLIKNKLNTLIEHMHEAVAITDSNFRITYINSAFIQLTGYTLKDVVDEIPSFLKSENGIFYKNLYEDLNSNVLFEGEVVDQKKSGEFIYTKAKMLPITNEFNEISNYILVVKDISEIKELRSKLSTSTKKDPLTKVNNRETFLNLLNMRVELSTSEQTVTLLFIDLNKFKLVNDTYGHQYGDIVLAQSAHRIESVLRKSDAVGRYGGDEFLVLLEKGSSEVVDEMTNRIFDEVSKPYIINGQEIDFISASIGLASAPTDAKTATELIEKADEAMYEAKNSRAEKTIFSFKDLTKTSREKRLHTELLNAVENEEFYIRIHPIIDMESREIVGGEVLTRWLNLYFDEVGPDTFFPIASKIGILKKIDLHIVESSLQLLSEYRVEGLFININFTAESFNDLYFINSIYSLLNRFPDAKNYLVIEVTEGTMMENIELTSEYLSALRKIGVKVAIDDFGTGFSSLAYLKHFSVDFLKIDKSFINNITKSRKDREIVKSIINLASAIDADTIVEGIETEEQYDILKDLGVKFGQGFYFDYPLYTDNFFRKTEIEKK
jgi:diguanylate cyclase (GGDEF)-like protein/PAS domain S-box-containing protein